MCIVTMAHVDDIHISHCITRCPLDIPAALRTALLYSFHVPWPGQSTARTSKLVQQITNFSKWRRCPLLL